MNGSTATGLLDSLLDPLSRCLDSESAARIADFCVDPSVQARIDQLAERANEGMLTGDERSEYEAFISAADFITVLQVRARKRLSSDTRA